jgi:hypothetical protein
MMPNEVEAYREGPKAFEYKGTSAFRMEKDVLIRVYLFL